MFVSAATCQMRAPSRCILMSLACANSAISITSFCGIIVPFNVFSSSMIAVGQLCVVVVVNTRQLKFQT